jgi:hypothetical protein
MPDVQRIHPVLVEKALEAFFGKYSSASEEGEKDGMEEALRVVFDELGLKEEQRGGPFRMCGRATDGI